MVRTNENDSPLISRRSKSEIILLICTFVWGSTFAIVKGNLALITPYVMIAIRFGISTALMLPGNTTILRRTSSRLLISGIVLGFLLTVGYATQTIGLEYTSASKSAFITGLMVVCTPLLQLLIERRSPTKGNVVGVFVVTAGLYLLTSPNGSSFNVGDGLTFVCVIAYSIYIVLLDIYTKRFPVGPLTVVIFGSTAIFSLIGLLLFEKPIVVLEWEPLAALLYLSVVATYGTLRLQAQYQRFTTPTRAAIVFSVEPVFAAFIAYLALGEILGVAGIVGGALIIIGILISELFETLFPKTPSSDSA